MDEGDGGDSNPLERSAYPHIIDGMHNLSPRLREQVVYFVFIEAGSSNKKRSKR